MKRIKKDKGYLLNLLADKKKELETYITDQKVNFKSIDSIKKLVDYYNLQFFIVNPVINEKEKNKISYNNEEQS